MEEIFKVIFYTPSFPPSRKEDYAAYFWMLATFVIVAIMIWKWMKQNLR